MCDAAIASRVEAPAALAREPSIEVALTKAGALWLVNRGKTAVNLSHGELFGFNVGSFVEAPSGPVISSNDENFSDER